MLDKIIPVISVTKDKLEVYKCQVGDQKSAKKIAEGSWNNNNLQTVIKNIITKLHYKKVRVLLADELSYSLEVSIKKDAKDERLAVKQKISEKIPADFSDKDWDYKVITEKLDTKLVKFFAPAKNFWETFSQAVNNVGLHIEAVEPVIIAKERHKNPIIGLCLKKDLKGKDEEVLNMKPIDTKDTKPDFSTSESKKSDSDNSTSKKTPSNFDYVDKLSSKSSAVNKKLIVSLIILFFASALVIGGILRSRKSKSKITPSLTSTTISEPEASSEPSPTPEAIDFFSYSTQVLNGSGVAGEAGLVKDTLETEGFKNIDTSNADNYDYTNTEISLKDDISEAVYDAIEQVLSNDYTVILDADPLTDDSEYDVVIVVGKKNKE